MEVRKRTTFWRPYFVGIPEICHLANELTSRKWKITMFFWGSHQLFLWTMASSSQAVNVTTRPGSPEFHWNPD